jgi:predicted phosphodiesterase
VYVPQGDGKSRAETEQVYSFQKFRGLLTAIQALDPSVIIHTGDVVDKGIANNREQLRMFRSQMPELQKERLFLYLRGNHDTILSDGRIRRLFPDWDVLAIDDASPVRLADGQLGVVGRDYQHVPTPEAFDVGSPDDAKESVTIGAFHQTVRQISRSYTADTDLADLTPGDTPAAEYYDLLLFGHMHTNHLDQKEGCTVIDGGSASGLDTNPTVGLLTFSEGAAHYQRFPLWVKEP